MAFGQDAPECLHGEVFQAFSREETLVHTQNTLERFHFLSGLGILHFLLQGDSEEAKESVVEVSLLNLLPP